MYNFYIDESGKPQLKSIPVVQPHFSLAGVLVHDEAKRAIKTRADQIKFKYWGTTDIVFHAREIRSNAGAFSIFAGANPQHSKADFYADLLNLLKFSFRIGIVTINKANFIASNGSLAHAIAVLSGNAAGNIEAMRAMVDGTEKNLLKRAATELLTMYLDYVTRKDARGEVLVESATELQDMTIFAAYNKVLISGFPAFKMSSIDVRRRLTGIAFVTKHNHDIEEQLADLVAHYLNIEARVVDGVLAGYPNVDDQTIIDALKQKTFNYRPAAGQPARNSLLRLY